MVNERKLCERHGGNFCSMETHAGMTMPTKQAVFDELRYQVRVDHHDTRRYFTSADVPHRTNDPPAIEWANGSKAW